VYVKRNQRSVPSFLLLPPVPAKSVKEKRSWN